MLVITRRLSEGVWLMRDGETLARVSIVKIQSGMEGGRPAVRLGIDAPKDVEVKRDELLLREEQA